MEGIIKAICISKQKGTEKHPVQDIDIIETGLVFGYSGTKTVTFDLNGHSIKTANTAKANISLQNKITVNLVDNSENNTGKIYSDTPYISGTQDKPVIVLITCNRRNRRLKLRRTAERCLLRGVNAERSLYACRHTLRA